MANANQVIVNGETILDLRSDTVTPETLQKGYTAHDKSGTKITGTLEASSVSVQPSKSVTITSNGTATITPDAPYGALKKVDVTVNVSGGGGGSGVGHKVSFPATAKNWNKVGSTAVLHLADNTTKSIANYSSISGQTIENVIGIGCQSNDEAYVLRMTLSEGGMTTTEISFTGYLRPTVSTAPGSTPTPYYGGTRVFWWPVADTVISAIEMYNTD